jgi:hypothetical protein
MQKITFATNVAKNTLAYLKLLLKSLKLNLDSEEHEILIFIDSDNEDCLKYLLSIKHEFKDLTIVQNTLPVPIGYARNKTLLTQYAKHDIISYLQSDMVVGPHYDTEILQHIKPGRILSATRVEPPLHGSSSVTITKNFGLHPDEFDMNGWNMFSGNNKYEKLINYFFAPITYYKNDWMKLNGYDTVFRRAREDSDFVQRCLHANIELVQTFSANVYHFTCVTSRGNDWFKQSNIAAQQRLQLQNVADSIEVKRFLRKWGNFNHGETPLQKLDIDLVSKNYRLEFIENIEPFFSRVWLSTENDRDSLITKYNNYHNVANELLHITSEDWEKYKHLYRVEDFTSTFLVGEPSDFSVKVEIDFNKVTANNQFLNNLQNLYQLLIDCEPGKYEIDNVIVTINTIKVLPVSIKADNPIFDNNVLTVY